MDATYRTDLRELNELNFARFDAKVEQRLAELDAKWQVRWDKLDAKLEQRIGEVKAMLLQEVALLRSELAGQRAELIRCMFGFWIATLVPLAGLMTTPVLVLHRTP